MNVLITGVAGFIGSHVADALLERGDDVFGIDNFETGLPGNVPADVDFTEGDVADEWALCGILDRSSPDVIVHAAATYRDPNAWHRDLVVNAEATAMIADHAQSLRAHLIYFQTSLCYGHVDPRVLIPVDHPCAPQSSYAISKTAGEQYIHLSGADAAVFRLANMYGPRNLSGPVPAFWKRLTAGQPCTIVDSRRDFVHVSDLARLVIQAIDERATGTWHASTGGDYSVEELYDTVVREGGFEQPRKTLVERGADDVATLLLDPSETEKRFGWKADVSLDEGVWTALQWYEQHGVTETFTHLKVSD